MMERPDLDKYGLETEICRLVLAHWLDVRGSDPVPRRAAIDPAVLKTALPHMFMLNMVDEETAVYRLVGTAHRARWGIELTGHVWGEFLDARQRIDRTRRLWRAIRQPCGFTARYELVFASGAHDPVETLLLPLRPNHPSGLPIMIGAGISTRQMTWVNQSGSVTSRTEERFRYLDLGHGVPST
ncbi:MAG TPA: PAS domain-containing protein [Aliidongia sp.]|nr:PAS domain-containing protein [Aliidongia sp.]